MFRPFDFLSVSLADVLTIGIGTMGAPGAGVPLCFEISDS